MNEDQRLNELLSENQIKRFDNLNISPILEVLEDMGEDDNERRFNIDRMLDDLENE